MNKQYIKRQIVLHKLGVPMDNDIQEMYYYVKKLTNYLEENKYNENFYAYYDTNKERTVLDIRVTEHENMFVVEWEIWNDFKNKFKLGNNKAVSNILLTFLNNFLNKNANELFYINI